MDAIYKQYVHNPPHLFMADTKYFITGATYQKIRHIKTVKTKEAVLKYMYKSFEHYGWKIEDWVLLDNHYHIMAISPENALTLSSVINNFHRFSANWIKKNIAESFEAKRIWANYWDKCITFEKSYFARLNYIWFNPVKHGYVENPEDWRFGSYHLRFENNQDLADIIDGYRFDKLKIEDDF